MTPWVVTSAAVYGGADIERQIKKLNKGVELVVATPGRLIDLIDRGVVDLQNVSLAVIDEADRMADMGFLPQVEWILRRVEGVHQTLLFSATLDGAIDGLVTRYQNDPVRHEVEAKEVTVEEMVHRFVQVHDMDRNKVVASIVNSGTRTMVFCNTKRACDRLAGDLSKLGVAAQAIHGDLRQRQREKALRDFSEGRIQALVATDVAARGIHVDDVDVVIHYDPPDDHKTYLHRSGRTARAGGSGVAVTLVLWNQELDVKRMQKRLALDIPIIEMFSNDDRLTDLAGWGSDRHRLSRWAGPRSHLITRSQPIRSGVQRWVGRLCRANAEVDRRGSWWRPWPIGWPSNTGGLPFTGVPTGAADLDPVGAPPGDGVEPVAGGFGPRGGRRRSTIAGPGGPGTRRGRWSRG